MTTPPLDPTHPSHAPGAAAQGCPMRAAASDGVRPLYGAEAESQPYALYEQLRAEHGEVAPVRLYGDEPAWLVLGHRENLEVMRSRRFSSDSRNWHAIQRGTLAPESPLRPITAWQPLVALTDGAEHARLREAVTDGLGRVNKHRMRRYVVRYATQLIDDFAGKGRADLVADFARKLPALVITQQLGIAEADALPVGSAVSDMISGGETALAGNELVVRTVHELVRSRKREPREDLASRLLAHPQGLSEEEVRQHLRLLLVGALEPTANLIANTLRLVLTDSRFRGNLSGGQMTLPDALEQVLWDHPPLAVVPTRWAKDDTDLGGTRIAAGDMVMLGLAAGNVDPAIRPDSSKPVHGNRSHLAFGAGAHECPGQDLGRAIAETGIDLLLERVPDLTLAVDDDELQVVGTWMSRRLTGLPVVFKPAQQERPSQAVQQPVVARAHLEPVAAGTGSGRPSSWRFWRR
ncbi:cytochrome P450 [Streptomyces sp. NPDC058646]|uniref:cytochrome P450 n=1 Tax=Streptomyces sp. NPDC058646 TaxID=3346574 RepID=UPI00364A24AD